MATFLATKIACRSIEKFPNRPSFSRDFVNSDCRLFLRPEIEDLGVGLWRFYQILYGYIEHTWAELWCFGPIWTIFWSLGSSKIPHAPKSLDYWSAKVYDEQSCPVNLIFYFRSFLVWKHPGSCAFIPSCGICRTFFESCVNEELKLYRKINRHEHLALTERQAADKS